MPDEDSSDSDEHQQPSFWRGLRTFLFGGDNEQMAGTDTTPPATKTQPATPPAATPPATPPAKQQ